MDKNDNDKINNLKKFKESTNLNSTAVSWLKSLKTIPIAILLSIVLIVSILFYRHEDRAIYQRILDLEESEITQSSDANDLDLNIADTTPPTIHLPTDNLVTSTSTISLDLYSSEEITLYSDNETNQNSYTTDLMIEETDNVLIPGSIPYLLTISNIVPGKNIIEISFTDSSGNITSEEITVDQIVIAPATAPAGVVEVKYSLDGNNLLSIVDKEYSLLSDYSPGDLVYIADYDISGVYANMMLREVVMEDLKEMKEDIEAQGMNISIISAYRSFDTQVSTFNYWAGLVGYEEASRVSAKAGHSEHQLGTTMDFTTQDINNTLSGDFGATEVGIWLAANSYKYGFILSYPDGKEDITGYSWEPWHFRYIGKEQAEKAYNSGLTLNQYLRTVN